MEWLFRIPYLWEEDKTRKLFKTHLILFFVGGMLASFYTILLPSGTNDIKSIILIPTLFTLSCIPYFLTLNKPKPGDRLLLFTLEGQLAASVFMALTGGFLGIVQFAPFMFLLFCVFELGAEATMILGSFAVLTFIGVLIWGLFGISQPDVIQNFIYYTGSYILIVVIERNIGKELSLQFEAKKRLERIDDLKNQFLALSSHYLGQPVTLIKGFSQMLEETNMTDFQRKQLERLEISIADLDALVGKMLAITAIGQGEATVNLKDADLNIVISEVISALDQVARERVVHLVFQPFPNPPKVKLDSGKFQMCLGYLIDNAIKFNRPNGFVNVSLLFNDQAIVEIDDTGVGISQERMDNMFESFNKGGMDEVLNFNHPGAGLSLYLAKLIMEAHKGKIEVQSEENKGTRVKLTLPI